jgi:hypothetical protein
MLVKPVINKVKTIPTTKFQYNIFKIADLSFSPLNPSVRTELRRVKSLATNIAKNGQNEPITIMEMVSNGNRLLRVVNGHRRCVALKELGHEDVHGILLTNKKINHDKAFTSLHEDTMKINAVQECERWLKGAKNISTRVTRRIYELENLLGKAIAKNTIKRCVSQDMSPFTILQGIKRFNTYTGNQARQRNSAVAYYLLNVCTEWRMRMAIESFIPVDVLIEHILTREPIAQSWASQN